MNTFCGFGNVFQNGECFQMIKIRDLCRLDLHEVYNSSIKGCVCDKGFK